MAIDRYDNGNGKKIDGGTTGVAREHTENNRLRGEVTKEGERQDGRTALDGAFKNYTKSSPSGTKSPSTLAGAGRLSAGSVAGGEGTVPKTNSSRFVARPEGKSEGTVPEKGPIKSTNFSPSGTKSPSTLAGEGRLSAGSVAGGEGNVPKNVNPNLTPTNLAQSTFAQNVRLPSDGLRNVLKPPSPPVGEGQGEGEKGGVPDKPLKAELVDSPTHVAPMATPDGTKMAATTTSERGEKKEATKNKEKPITNKGAKAGGKGGSLSAEQAGGEQKLEAASSGVTSGGGEEPVLLTGFNPSSEVDENYLLVKEGHMLCERDILKPKTLNDYWASLQNENPSALDPILERIVDENRPFPNNVYGGKRG